MNRQTFYCVIALSVIAAGGLCSAAPDWAESYEQAVKISKAQNKPILAFFTSGSG